MNNIDKQAANNDHMRESVACSESSEVAELGKLAVISGGLLVAGGLVVEAVAPNAPGEFAAVIGVGGVAVGAMISAINKALDY